ncbi:hypothetical protein ACQKDS_03425 [Serratia sp. NPDC078593]|uniref:hypothetical protein n=1 Tax=unclassified Serratia (in: enterobacteria) TaxID=2647522 RepID=UPI0037D424C9
MSDLEQLQQKLASALTENEFLLDSRTVNDLLTNVAEYTQRVPFAGHTDAFWASFWMENCTLATLSNIYHNPALAAKKLPVQQAFLLALLQLLETPKALLNTLPARHRSLYYRELLGFSPRDNQPDSVAVNFTLQKNTAPYRLPGGSLLDAGLDSAGNNLTYQTDDSLLVTGQELKQLCWTRKNAEAAWQFCTALDTDNDIALPDGGVRLFAETQNETPWSVQTRLDTPLTALKGERTVTVTWALEDAGSAAMPEMVWLDDGQHQVLRADRLSPHQHLYRLPAEALSDSKAPRAAGSDASLALQFPVGQRVAWPATLNVAIHNCQEMGYRAQGGHGHLDAFSYPFGLSPHSGHAFELKLPTSMLRAGGELTIEPQWCSLPQENFARWYADYPAPPAENGAFKVQFYLTTPKGCYPLGEEQTLFCGDGAPQMVPLHAILPADSTLSADADVTVSVVLSGTDFFHADWQRNPAGKNAPWTPQVSRIDTRFQQRLSLPVAETSPEEEANQQALYLGFSGVAAQDTLSVYWSLRASSALELSWQYYNQQNQWASLDAVVQDDTAGLSVSNPWRATLPDDIQSGGEGLVSDYYWIKAIPKVGATFSADDMPKLQGVMANAMTATLNNSAQVDDQHFTLPLPADTISQLVSPVDAISHISQPLPSTGGRVRETEKAMLQRATTRIAHRQRAITWGNMRSLLMDQYPQIFDVRFPDVEKLNHIPALDAQTLMVIPDSRYCDNDDTLRPVLSDGRLVMMAQWLSQYTSLWAEPKLANPTYVDVTACYQVIFMPGIHSDYGYRQLEIQLRQQYMPWGDDRRLAVTPGNQVDYYQLLATLQQSTVVKRVVSLTLSRSKGEETQQTIIAKDNEVLILHSNTSLSTGEAYV